MRHSNVNDAKMGNNSLKHQHFYMEILARMSLLYEEVNE